MDDLLARVISFSCTVRDSGEAHSWRQAWTSLTEIEPGLIPPIPLLPIEEIPVIAHLAGVRASEQGQARPLMFPLLLTRFPINLSANQIRQKLKEFPNVLAAYERLVASLGFSALILEYLRSIAPGYPHENLVFYVNGSPWTRLNNISEVPLNIGVSLLPPGAKSATEIGTGRFVPSVAKPVVVELDSLASAIVSSPSYIQLERAYETLSSRKNLRNELVRARVEFTKKLQELNKLGLPMEIWKQRVEMLAKKVYLKRGPRIQSYVEAFREYEWLIEKIYWVISQLVIYEGISCLSTLHPYQLQQVSMSIEKSCLLSGITFGFAKTMEVGQLVHLSLPETGGIVDGVYQVRHWYLRFDVKEGTRQMFNARMVWGGDLNTLNSHLPEVGNPILIPTEPRPESSEYKIKIGGEDEEAITLLMGDPVLNMEIHKTMYLP